MTLVSDLTGEVLRYAYKEFNRPNNRKRLAFMIETVTNMAIGRIQPYMYAIMAILVIMFLLNCFQFYYYLKYIMLYHKNAVAIDSISLPN
jgi:hypothetical protein